MQNIIIGRWIIFFNTLIFKLENKFLNISLLTFSLLIAYIIFTSVPIYYFMLKMYAFIVFQNILDANTFLQLTNFRIFLQFRNVLYRKSSNM